MRARTYPHPNTYTICLPLLSLRYVCQRSRDYCDYEQDQKTVATNSTGRYVRIGGIAICSVYRCAYKLYAWYYSGLQAASLKFCIMDCFCRKINVANAQCFLNRLYYQQLPVERSFTPGTGTVVPASGQLHAPAPSSPGNEAPYPRNRRLDGPQSRS